MNVALGILVAAACGGGPVLGAESGAPPASTAGQPSRGLVQLADSSVAGKNREAIKLTPVEAVEVFLARTIDLQCDNVPLSEVAGTLAKLGDVPVFLDDARLEEIGIDKQSPVTLRVKGISAASALRHVLRRLDPTLCFVNKQGVLTITTQEAAQEDLGHRIFNVADIVRPKPHRAVQHARTGQRDASDKESDKLIELISATIEPEAWDINGGFFCLKPMGPGTIVVTATEGMHSRVADFLAQLRTMRDSQQNGAAAVPRSVALVSPAERAFDEKLRKAMERPITLDFEEAPLEEVVSFLSQASGLLFVLDEKSVEEIGVGPDTPVTIHLKNVSTRVAFKLLLQTIDRTLTWGSHDEALFIRTRETECQAPNLVLYPVSDLIHPAAQSGLMPIRMEELRKALQAVQPDTWSDEGGLGEIQFVNSCGAMIVSQGDSVHEELAALLDRLRKTRREQAAAKAFESWPNSETVLVVYHLRAPVQRPRAVPEPQPQPQPQSGPQPRSPDSEPAALHVLQIGGGGVREGSLLITTSAVADANFEKLRELVFDETKQADWPAGKTSIRAIGNQLIIRQTPAMHERIHALFDALELLEPAKEEAKFFPGSSFGLHGFSGLNDEFGNYEPHPPTSETTPKGETKPEAERVPRDKTPKENPTQISNGAATGRSAE